MKRLLVACLLAGAPLIAASHATADPEDLVPYCSGDQTPMDNNCRQMAHQVFTHGSGVDPNLPGDLDPNEPVT